MEATMGAKRGVLAPVAGFLRWLRRDLRGAVSLGFLVFLVVVADHLLRVAGAAEEGEVGGGLEFGVVGHEG